MTNLTVNKQQKSGGETLNKHSNNFVLLNNLKDKIWTNGIPGNLGLTIILLSLVVYVHGIRNHDLPDLSLLLWPLDQCASHIKIRPHFYNIFTIFETKFLLEITSNFKHVFFIVELVKKFVEMATYI